EAAMRLRSHRRNLVAWSRTNAADRYGDPRLMRPVGTRRIRRSLHTGTLITVIGLMRLARGARHRWRPLLAGTALTVVGVMLRGGVGTTDYPPRTLVPGVHPSNSCQLCHGS